MRMKKRLLLWLWLCLSITHLFAQQYGNEWIRFNQLYYKCKVAQNGMYRVPIAALFNLGFPTGTVGASLQVFRDGQEIPIRVSSSSILTPTDYLEFYGEKANGKIEKKLYADSTMQLNPDLNLVADTAYYFITFNNSTNNLRYTQFNNTLSGLPAKENYLFKIDAINYRTELARGESSVEGQYQVPEMYTLNSSQYEREGYVKRFTTAKDSVTINLNNPYTQTGSPDIQFQTIVVGKSYLSNHNISVQVNGNLIGDTTYAKFDFVQFKKSFPMSYVNTSNQTCKFVYQPSGAANDRYGISMLQVKYPATTDLANATNQYFEVNPKNGTYYFEFTNVNKGGQLPVLFNLTTRQFIVADTSLAGIVRFAFPGTTAIQKLVLQSQQSTAIKSVQQLQVANFVNYFNPAVHGNYIIITDQRYRNDGAGNDYVNDYKNYRSSAVGGSYAPIIVHLQDIYNEFGYGYDFSTLAVKNFLQFAYEHPAWSTNRPNHVLIMGKGLEYYNYNAYKAANPASYPFYAAPTFGQPGSDWLFTDFAKNDKPLIPIGRLSVFKPIDIKNYLDKVIAYESTMRTAHHTVADKMWQKNVLHIGGISDSLQSLPIKSALEREAGIISGDYFGAYTTVLNKNINPTIEAQNSHIIDSFFNHGSRIIYFFGHSSATTIDYGLDFPERYQNLNKYPLMIANGCGAGNIFIYTGQKYLSERYVSAAGKGAIAFIASVNTGFSGNLGLYTDSLYGEIAKASYGQTIGQQMRKNIQNLVTNPFIGGDFLFRMHTEQILLNGDPAIKLATDNLPDYVADSSSIVIEPSVIHTGDDSFTVKITLYNIGKYTTDSVHIDIKRTLPDGVVADIMNKKIPGFGAQANFIFKLPVLGNLGAGTNILSVAIDKSNLISELSNTNNSISKSFTITNSGALPVYPAQFSIVSTSPLTLKATTLNPFEAQLNYQFQIDTTALFNSPLLRTGNVNSVGGVLSWQPNLTYTDSTVYYWRVAINENNPSWKSSSFIYIQNSLPGWNQSHYYQFLTDDFQSIELPATTRKFNYITENSLLQVQNVCLYGPTPFNYGWPDYLVKINGSTLYTFGCDPYPGYSSLQFVVIDSLTGEPWINKRPDSTVAVGMYGSFDPCRISVGGKYNDPFFEFNFLTAASRKNIIDFIHLIPTGNYIMMQPRLCVGSGCGAINTGFIRQWKTDTTTLGSGNSLYHELYNMGFTEIDSFYKNRPMIFWTRKNDPSTVKQITGKDSTEKLFGEFQFKNFLNEGSIESPRIGPAQQWNMFKRNVMAVENTPGDKTYFDVYGITATGVKQLITSVVSDTSLAFISSTTYPYLQLVMHSSDLQTHTPEQLKFWRIYYTAVPEGAVNPAKAYSVTNGTVPGTKVIKVAYENITGFTMDSVLVRFSILDRKNQVYFSEMRRYPPLAALDTMLIEYVLQTNGLYANMEFQVEVNPNNDQLEQYHGNNFALRNIGLIDPSVPLPVNLDAFGVWADVCDAQLQWESSAEVNLSRYEIERKEAQTYIGVATVYPNNSSQGKHVYHYVDKDLPQATYVYRIKMVDLDDKFAYSPESAVHIRCAQQTEVILFPNPAQDRVQLVVPVQEKQEIHISCIDMFGRTVQEISVDAQAGNNTYTMPTAQLAKGIYQCVLWFDGQKQIIPFTIN